MIDRVKRFFNVTKPLGSPEESIKESITSFILNQIMKILREVGVPYGSRTRVAAVKGRIGHTRVYYRISNDTNLSFVKIEFSSPAGLDAIVCLGI